MPHSIVFFALNKGVVGHKPCIPIYYRTTEFSETQLIWDYGFGTHILYEYCNEIPNCDQYDRNMLYFAHGYYYK